MAVALAATEYGDGKPVAILHGLFGSGAELGEHRAAPRRDAIA